MPGMEFRYVLGEAQKGTLIGSFLHDELSDPSVSYTHTNQDRYWLRGKIDHDLPDNLYTRIDLDVVSDRDYLTEFNTGYTGFNPTNNRFLSVYGRNFQNYTDDQRLNTVKVLKAWDSMSLETNFLAVNDVRRDPNSSSPLWKLPGLDFTGSLPLGETSLTADWNADYVHYWRENGVGGVGGQRVDLFPRLSTPVPLGPYLESRAEAGVRNTSYVVTTNGDGVWNQDETPNRTLFNLHGEVGTSLIRNFGLSNGESSRWDHLLRPRVEYDFIPETDQSDLPLFDSADRIEEANAITYGIDNFLTLFGDNNGISGRDYGYFKIWESYDLRSEYSDNPLTPVSLKLGWTPVNNFSFVYQTDIGIYGEGVTLYKLGSSYMNSRGDSVGVDYRYSNADAIIGSPYSSTDSYNSSSPLYPYYYLQDIHQINVGFRVKIIDTIHAAYKIEHSLTESQTIEQDISLVYQPACWSVELRSNYTPGDQGIMLLFNLANIGHPFGINLPGQ